MAGRILQEDIDALKRRADIIEVASDYTRMQKAGQRWKGLCPFHQEKTPSFTVDPQQNLWHCFGCSEGGDIYTFVEKVEGLTFTEAVEHLARRSGVQLRYEELSAGQKRALGLRSRLVAANAAASEFFRTRLLSPQGEPARRYLKERGFGREDVDQFQVGFAPLEWRALADHLRDQRFTEDELEKAGLAKRSGRGDLIDRFRGRLIFPVMDLSGDVIGFGGRVVPDLDYGDHDPPKYLNSPETPIYRKHEVLYGMSWARPEVVRTGEVLIAEGYTDVMALHQAGFTNAVATCGTAVGEDHLDLLERYAQHVVLAFDSDEAGERAAERAFELAQGRDMEVRVLVLPDGQDPADIVSHAGVDRVRQLVDDAEPVVRFMLGRATAGHDGSPEGRAAAVDAAAGIIAEIDDPVLADEYLRWVADERVGIAPRVVAAAVDRAGRSPEAADHDGVPTPPERSPSRNRSQLSSRAKLEREVLRVALQRPELLPDRWTEVGEDDFSHPKARAVYRALEAGGGTEADLESILEAGEDDEVRQLVRSVALEEFTVEPDEPHVAMVVSRLLLRRIEREIGRRKRELERMNPATDLDSYRERFEHLVGLEGRRRDLLEEANG